jgi:tripartite-type tricarboxylate transporter receptor subunit TctC
MSAEALGRELVLAVAALAGETLMNPFLRRLLITVAVAALAPVFSQIAQAQPYPAGPVKLVVGFAPGNAPDIVARLVGEQLASRFGQPVIIENRPGAASTIAARSVATSTPDGQTLLLLTPANAINPRLSGGGMFVDQIAPIASIASGPMVIVVNASSSIKTLPDLVSAARAEPGKILIGSPGTRTTPYLTVVLFKMMTGLDMLHVPFGGTSQAITELLGERVQVAVGDMSAISFIRSGKVRALAVTSATPQPMLPGVPAVGDVVPGYEASTWYGIGAPKGTPAPIIERVQAEIDQSLTDEKIKERLTSMGLTTEKRSSAEFARYVVDETAKWAKVSQFASAKK